MQCRNVYGATSRFFGLAAALLSTVVNLVAPPSLAAETRKKPTTATPIQHVIVIIGENRSFDHVYGTYQPVGNQTVSNLLSKGIVTGDGKPGPNYALAQQNSALDQTTYAISPAGKAAYKPLPPAMTAGAPTAPSNADPAPFQTEAVAKLAEPDLFGKYYRFLTTGATNLPKDTIDTRIRNVNKLSDGPFRLTPGVKYDDYAASPVHRFYQMWQQTDCSTANSTTNNPSGCLSDLFSWVEVTIGAGSNGNPQPVPFNNQTTGEGSTALGMYDIENGDAPYMKYLAGEWVFVRALASSPLAESCSHRRLLCRA
jgi:phospholipase C